MAAGLQMAAAMAARVLPLLLLWFGLLGSTVVVDWLLHLAHLPAVGRWLGPVGVVLIVASFAYSLRKRKIITTGAPGRFLLAHEVLGWVGALAVLVHGGIHFNAWLAWLAMAAMLVVVASGLTGKYLLRAARDSLRDREAELGAEGVPPDEINRLMLGHALVVGTMKEWRRAHMPLTMVFTALAAVHVTASVVLGSWGRWR